MSQLSDLIHKLVKILAQEGDLPVVCNGSDIAYSLNANNHISVVSVRLEKGVLTSGNVKAVVIN